ncbi:transcription initiation factor TFIIIB [Clostridium estertheticum]|uniref:transcription initiation factor TFIIIB n=1 Tax=Clostridium estertheticum TaxID=238834 RepID=UPI0013E94052|nr:transcription initiation factor TFIIIB [Clostridium estertheticum]MBZ9685249.1 transcription initiation factor TFIIIB [Clostridium estertheticum]
MEREKKCPECGCEKIAQAKLDINAKLYPIDAFFKIMNGSEVNAEVCTKCGYILNMRVLTPEKFK